MLWWSGNEVRRTVSAKALQAFRHRVRQVTRRNDGRSMAEVIERLRSYALGWKGYFGLAQTLSVWLKLDQWIRCRPRALQLKQWRRGKTIYRELLRLGATPWVAQSVAALSRRWWHNSPSAVHHVLDDRLLRSSGRTPSLMTSTSRTARCGPACRLVWEGSGPDGPAPIPITECEFPPKMPFECKSSECSFFLDRQVEPLGPCLGFASEAAVGMPSR